MDRLRGKWYPAPRYVARGLHPEGCYSIQSMLPGAPIRRLTPAQVEQLALTAGLSVEARQVFIMSMNIRESHSSLRPGIGKHV